MGFVTREAIGSESYWYPKNAARDQMPHEFQEMPHSEDCLSSQGTIPCARHEEQGKRNTEAK
jgi:hypothetical protein